MTGPNKIARKEAKHIQKWQQDLAFEITSISDRKPHRRFQFCFDLAETEYSSL